MAKLCKTCHHSLRNEIDLKIMQGVSFYKISQWCDDRGFKISCTALKNHATRHIANYKERKLADIKEVKKVDDIAYEKADPSMVDFDDYLKKIKLDYKQVITDNDCKSHLHSLQLSTVENYFLLSAILNQKLLDYQIGKTKFPLDQVKALRTFSDVYLKVTGLDFELDHNKAFEIINKYYGMNVVITDVDNPNILSIKQKDNSLITIDLNEKSVKIDR